MSAPKPFHIANVQPPTFPMRYITLAGNFHIDEDQ